jgi:hypothetical protein
MNFKCILNIKYDENCKKTRRTSSLWTVLKKCFYLKKNLISFDERPLYQRTCAKTPIYFINFFKYHEIWNSGHAQLLSSQIKNYPEKKRNFWYPGARSSCTKKWKKSLFGLVYRPVRSYKNFGHHFLKMSNTYL